jgi:hypothetical protein
LLQISVTEVTFTEKNDRFLLLTAIHTKNILKPVTERMFKGSGTASVVSMWRCTCIMDAEEWSS